MRKKIIIVSEGVIETHDDRKTIVKRQGELKNLFKEVEGLEVVLDCKVMEFNNNIKNDGMEVSKLLTGIDNNLLVRILDKNNDRRLEDLGYACKSHYSLYISIDLDNFKGIDLLSI